MSKSILVMNTPNKCLEDCNLCQLDTDGEIICWFYNKRIGDVLNYEKPDWCPLKELPKEEHNDLMYDEYYDGYDDGWNNCLNKIINN